MERLLGLGNNRDKTRVVSYQVPFNAATQIYNYKSNTSRVVIGPKLVTLQPDEQFTVMHLSGSKPKRPGVIQTLHINLGPDFFTDIFTVETADHAKLELQLSYNWHFNLQSEEDKMKIFNVRDFVGDACSLIASMVRGKVASLKFDTFHKLSNLVGKFEFPANNLVITNVDIQRVEPVEENTKRSLQESMNKTFEITTKRQEDEAKHEANRKKQEADGKLTKQKIEDNAASEEQKKEYYEL